MKAAFLLALSLTTLLMPLGIAAQSLPLGDEFQVNTYTSDNQQRAAVAMEPGGDFVVVWNSYGSGGTDADASSIQGQRYTFDGSVLGDEFQVNSYTTSLQSGAAVAAGSSGDFVVAWESFGSGSSDSSSWSVQGQRYASDGSVLGNEFQVNAYTSGVQIDPAVALGPGGGFVVAWQSDGSGGTDGSSFSIQGQRWASDGSVLGSQFQINSFTTLYQRHPAVAVGSSGGFVVVWQSFPSGGADSGSFSIQGQRYASDGSVLGGEFQVNSYTTDNQRYPSVAVESSGDFVVVWESLGSGGTDSSSYSVQGQRYASDGSVLGGEFQVNTYTLSWQRYPAVSVESGGDFVVVWQSMVSGGTDSSAASVQGQRYASDGSVLGDQFQVNSYTTNAQLVPSVAAKSGGDFVVVWHSIGSGGTDADGSSVQGQRYDDPQSIFGDGFESGDTSAWG